MKNVWKLFWPVAVASVLVLAAALLGQQAANATSHVLNVDAPEPAVAQAATGQGRERLYFATGEYDCQRDWDAIVRLDDLSLSSAEGVTLTEDLLIPVKQLMTDTVGLPLNFVHNIYVHEERDEMYMASIFTGLPEDFTACDSNHMDLEAGSVAVLSNVSGEPGQQTLERHLYGENTGLNQPHGVWVDHDQEELYVANTHEGNILVFENAYTVDGNVAPSRVITSSLMKAPTHIYLDEESDRLFVTNFSGEELKLEEDETYPDDGSLPSVLIFNNASSLNGEAAPDIRIVDNDGDFPDPTRLRQGVAHITHNVWYDEEHNLIFVVHHTNEVLIFDLNRIGSAPPAGCYNAERCAMPPKAIIEVGRDSPGQYFSAYGLYYLPGFDRLYVTVGRTDADPSSDTGYVIVPGVPPNVVLAYDNVSEYESMAPFPFTPTRRIYWQSGADQYYPPQPLWVTVDFPVYLPMMSYE